MADVRPGARSRERVRKELVARVRGRRAELEEAILARIRAGVSSEAHEADAEYAVGLRMAVTAAVEHGLAAIESGYDGAEAAPIEAIAQARRAARIGVSVDTVVCRYVLGSNLIGDFLMQEADWGACGEHGETLREMLSALGGVLERLLRAITDAYNSELERAGRSPEQRRAERVQRLLAGGRCDTADLGYEIEGWHIGLIATGAEAVVALRGVAAGTGRALLCVPCGDDTAWGWLGGQTRLAVADIERLLFSCGAQADASLAIGEPGHGIEGWRLTHRQAQAALRVALQRPQPQQLTRYCDVALLASMLQDSALAGSLVDIYLAPLGSNENGGAILRQTLRAYFAAENNASSAASALGVARHTVENRLRAIEEKLGQRLRARQAELEVALRLEELGA